MRALRLWTAAAAGPAVAAGFYALAALRRRRSLHPRGIGHQGWLQVPNESLPRPGVPLFQAGATHQALIRFSRGAGLPEQLPDAHGPGVDQDLLLTSSTDRPLLRRLLFPARSFVRGAFSTALPYDLGNERVVLLLVPMPTSAGPSTGGQGHRHVGGALAELRAVAANSLELELRTATSFGHSQPLATMTVGPPLSPDRTEALRFNPWTTGPGIHPSGWLNLLRDAAYQASQRGRVRNTPTPATSVVQVRWRGGVENQVPSRGVRLEALPPRPWGAVQPAARAVRAACQRRPASLPMTREPMVGSMDIEGLSAADIRQCGA